jgi:transposase
MPNTTETTNGELEILKQDKIGRVHTPEKRREILLEQYERSGMSGMQYAAYIGVKYPTFANWKQKWRQRKAAATKAISVKKNGDLKKASLKWVEASLETKEEENKTASSLIVELACGGRMKMDNTKQVELAAELLKKLASGGRVRC